MYEVLFSKNIINVLSKSDKQIATMILNWIEINLEKTTNPRHKGKPLKGNHKGLWRYRVGTYRLLCEFKDDKLIILLMEIGHRSNAYR